MTGAKHAGVVQVGVGGGAVNGKFVGVVGGPPCEIAVAAKGGVADAKVAAPT